MSMAASACHVLQLRTLPRGARTTRGPLPSMSELMGPLSSGIYSPLTHEAPVGDQGLNGSNVRGRGPIPGALGHYAPDGAKRSFDTDPRAQWPLVFERLRRAQ